MIENTKYNRIASALAAAALGMMLVVGVVRAQTAAYYTGEITMLEAWRTGNVAFTLNAAGVPCNGQFILNKSDPGTPRLYAMLVAAKAADRTVRAYFDFCGPAEGYGSTNYAQVAYLYLN